MDPRGEEKQKGDQYRSYTRTTDAIRDELNPERQTENGRYKAEELFVTRGAYGEMRPWNCRGERMQGYIRERDGSFMQAAIVNQSASTAGHEVDAGARDQKSESDPGGEERARRR